MSSYFFNLEKYKQKKGSIQKLQRDEDDVVITDYQDILEYQTKFYRKMYAHHDQELRPLPFIVPRMLTRDVKDNLDEPLTMQELDVALNSVANDKTPGPDGLSVNFYKKFWPKLRNILFQVYTLGLEDERLHPTAYDGNISLLPKKGRNMLRVKNWRPLTLLNNDYKILSKALSNRLQSVLDYIIDEEQTGFVKG